VKRTVPTVIVERGILMREGIRSLLNGTCYKVILSCASAFELTNISASAQRAALVILGFGNGLEDTLRAAQSARRIFPRCKVLIIAQRTHQTDIKVLLNSGIDAIVLHVSSQEALLKALDLAFLNAQLVVLGHRLSLKNIPLVAPEIAPSSVAQETAPLPEAQQETLNISSIVSSASAPPHLLLRLSDRERRVLLCMARGTPNKKIARDCSITEATVKVHIKAILRKISVQNRTQAALWAVKHRLVDNESAIPSAMLPMDGSRHSIET
jgi:two-component system, NarL family, nitrate/nitrite response regulator NarL